MSGLPWSLAGLAALAAALAAAAGLAVLGAGAAGAGGRARRRALEAAVGGSGARGGASVGGPPPWLVRRLTAAGLEAVAPVALRAWAAGGVGVVLLASQLGGVLLAVLAAVAALGGPPLVVVALRDRGDRRLEGAVPEVLEAVGRSLRSGASLRQALVESGRGAPPALAADLEAIAAAVGHGSPLVMALDDWADRRPLPSVRLAVAALALGAEAGGAQARAVDGVAATLRGRLAVQAEVTAMASQARASALVITVAPLGFAVMAAASDERTADFLLRTPVGVACLATGLALDAMSAWWMRRLTRIDG